MSKIISAMLFVLSMFLVDKANAQVPPPSETPAKIVVSGRTSTAVDIKIVKVGQEIPKTYSGTMAKNTPGFEWYVSEHYALKSDKGDEFSKMMLEVSELALPHWLEMTGLELKDPDTRMYMIYAGNMDKLNDAMQSDFGARAGGGGGITMWANFGAYNYPSGGLQYHLKDLVIHENLHMLQGVVLRNNMGTEGFTYGGSQYVYDSDKKQLTVMVFDRAPMNNFTDGGVRALQKEFIPVQTMITNHWNEGGNYGSVYSHFFWSDPDRWFKWCIWRDEFYKGKVNKETNTRVMEDIFGPLDKLNADWERWVKARRITFHHVDWGWEQNGNKIYAYGFPWDGKFWSQMDIQHAPKEKVEYDPVRMDYPVEPMPAIVGPVKRGVEEPAVGFTVTGAGGNCWAGLGLGLESPRSMCQVVIAGDKNLVIDGKDMGIARQEFPLTEEVKEAAKSEKGKYGVTIQIKKDKLEVTIRAGTPGAMKEMKSAVSIDVAQRERLMSKYMSMICKSGYPAFQLFIDDARKPDPDLMKPAPANKWRFPCEPELYGIYRAVWKLKDNAPASLVKLRDSMVSLVDKEPEQQKTAMDIYKKDIVTVLQDIQKVQDKALASLATSELLGISLKLVVDPETTADKAEVVVEIKVKGQNEVKGTVALSETPAGTVGAPADSKQVQISKGTQKLSWTCKVPADSRGISELTAKASLICNGITIDLQDSKTIRPSIPCWWTIGPFDNKGDCTVDTEQVIETEKIDLQKKYTGKAGKEIKWQMAERPADAKLMSEFVMDFTKLYGGDNVSAYALTWIISPKEQDAVIGIGADDGIAVWFNGQKVFKNLVGRPYSSVQDKIPVRLKAGRNQLLVKVTQGGGGWAMGAQVLNKDGSPLIGLLYSIKSRVSFEMPKQIMGGSQLKLSDVIFSPNKADSKVDGSLFWRKKGAGTFAKLPLTAKGGNKYEAVISAEATKAPFEFYFEFQESGEQPVQEPNEGAKNPLTVTPDVEPPSTVSALTAPVVKDYGVTLKWAAASDDTKVAEYRIYRGDADRFPIAPEKMLGKPVQDGLTFADNTPTASKTSWYAVRAVDEAGREGAPVYLKVDVPGKEAPANNLKVKSTPGSECVTLSWEGELEPDVAGYEIYRGEGKDGALELVKKIEGADSKSFVDKGVKSGQTFRYAVALYDTGGLKSKQSEPVTASALKFIKRINCGGKEVVSADGANWEADESGKDQNPALRSSGTSTWKVQDEVKNAGELKEIYQSERWANVHVSYAFEVKPGKYEVILHLAETNPSFFEKGKRTFDVLINDEKAGEKVDVFANAGQMTAWQWKKTVDVNGSELKVKLNGNPTGPAIKGIEILGL